MATKLQRSNFSVQSYLPARLGRLRGVAAAAIDTSLGLRKLADFYYGFAADLSPVELAREVIAGLGVSVNVENDELSFVPAKGPCIVVSNHPHGMLDGLIIMDGSRRALFLPSVWEQLPKPEDFLTQLKLKASMSADHWSESFQAQRFITGDVKQCKLPEPQCIWKQTTDQTEDT